jgi:6-phosphogluconolactonase/glucosamine-6-phosphate isomerase/deaminase
MSSNSKSAHKYMLERERLEGKFNKVSISETIEQFGQESGLFWKQLEDQYARNGTFYVASPISNTPIPIYTWIIQHAREFANWQNFRFVLMDEQVEGTGNGVFSYISETDPASFEGKIKNVLFQPVTDATGVDIRNAAVKPNLEALHSFDAELEERNGLDLLVLAIGEGGHYAQVRPGTPLDKGFHIAHLRGDYKERHTKIEGQLFSGSEFREYGMSLGPKQVEGAKHIAIIITGSSKQDLTRQLFSYTSFNPDFPMSIIHELEVAKKTNLFLTKDVLG